MARREANPLEAALKEFRSGLPVLVAFSFAMNVLILVSPIYMWLMYDRVLASGRVETLVFLTVIAAIAVLVMGALETVRGRLLGRMSRWLERRLAPNLIAASIRGALYGASTSAQSLRDLGTIRAFLSGPGVSAMFDSPWAPIFLAIIGLMHPLLGIIGVAAAVILFLIALLNEYISRRPLKEAGQISIAIVQQADAAIRNADVFHAMGMLPGFLVGWTARNENSLGLQLNAGDRNAALVGLSKFFRVFVQILMLGAGAYLVIQQELTSGGMIAGSILLGRALAPVEQTIGAWKGLIAARDSYDRLQRLLERVPPEPEGMSVPAPKGRLTCEQVLFVPRGREHPVLNGVTFALEAGEALGIIGPSAAGKSTLCKILVGTWQPTRGHARLDGADLFAWPPEQLGPYIGYLPQDVELFGGTVRDNIARLAADPDPAAVVEAALTAGVHDIVLRLPKGYETEIGEHGSFLSGGQRQRIGLARALYGRPRLLVLDEPNASLDGEGEEGLVTAIQSAKEWGATVVIVAHQPRILRPVDKILLLRDGRVELFGPRDEVYARLRPMRVAPAERPQVVSDHAGPPATMARGSGASGRAGE
jgi:PrtD family type I secretion system ABC transporter